MKYPILNISINEWNNNEVDYSIILLEDEYIYTSDESLFNKYFFNNKYVDSNGEIYRIIGRELPTPWMKFFSFLPNLYKVELIFEKTEDRISVHDLKSYITNNIKKLGELYDFEINWLNRIKEATSYEQILNLWMSPV